MALQVISIGGSLLYPQKGIDTSYLSDLCEFAYKRISKGDKLVLITGGGYLARSSQTSFLELLSENGLSEDKTSEKRDLIGIAATRFNAELLMIALNSKNTITYPKVLTDLLKAPDKPLLPILISAGWKPGCSTDKDAVELAIKYNSRKVANLTNTNGVYDSDPKTNSRAKRIKELTWRQYLSLIENHWTPGLSTPFDPVASRLASQKSINVGIIDGKNFKSIESFLDDQDFDGTLIR
jgi:uridylate kinase